MHVVRLHDGHRCPLFDPLVNFVQFVAVKIKNESMSVCGQTGGLLPSMR